MKVNDQVKDDYTFTIIIPVLHEAGIINPLIEHLYHLQSVEDCEIIIVDGDPARGTINKLHYKDVNVLVSEPGRGRQMNAGASDALGEILIFLHADTCLPVDALNLIRHALGNRQYVAGAFDLGIKSKKLIFKVIAQAASLRSRFTRMPYGDQVIFIRKDYFQTIGGYRTIPLMEDVDLFKRIKKRGDTICILPARALTSPRRWEKEGIISCTLRNWMLIILYQIGVSPEKLAHFYRNK
jgi:rSAM/selenodomain-associated transferase 2